jgi:hypothetical protein
MDLRELLIYTRNLRGETLNPYGRYDPLPEMIRDRIEALLEETLREVDRLRTIGTDIPDEVFLRRSFERCRRRVKDGTTLMASEGDSAMGELMNYLLIALKYMGLALIASGLSGVRWRPEAGRQREPRSEMQESLVLDEQARQP